MSDKIISIRKIEGAHILDTMNCAAISENQSIVRGDICGR